MAGRPRKQWADILDEFLESASEEEIRDTVFRIGVWSKWRKAPFKVVLEPVKPVSTGATLARALKKATKGTPLLDAE